MQNNNTKTIIKDLNLELDSTEIKELNELLEDIETEIVEDIILFINETDGQDSAIEVIEEILNKIDSEDDFYIEVDSKEYRFIHDRIIEDEFYNYQVDLIDECYLSNVPEIVKNYFDYDKFISDCEYDGYANTFSSYDGSTEIELTNYTVFRTN